MEEVNGVWLVFDSNDFRGVNSVHKTRELAEGKAELLKWRYERDEIKGVKIEVVYYHVWKSNVS